MVHIVLLSGGSGSRLWPLSNASRSKQFLKVLRDEDGKPASMVQRVFKQIRNAAIDSDITIATCSNQENSIRTQIEGVYNLVLEPSRRDTMPAIMLACAYLDLVQRAPLSDSVVVMPIDTYADQSYFDHVFNLHDCIQSGVSDLVLLGVEPTYPSAKYGYIIPDQAIDGAYCVAEFVEKPSEEDAAGFIKRGALWNCGVFGFKLSFIRSLTSAYSDAETYESFVSDYAKLPKMSFDYGVVEHTDSIAVVPYSGSWKDLGTWNTLTEEMASWVKGKAITYSNDNVHIINETSLPMVVAGLKDAVVVATHDGILVSEKETSANIKQQVEAACESRPMYEKRKWGEYRVLEFHSETDGVNALTKELTILANRQLSYQRHTHRSEVWTVISGKGEAVVDGVVIPLSQGSVLSIGPMQKHAVRAFDDLHVIEVQIGSILIEEDIERFPDFWPVD